jgi:seryl-tRNA synthetase
MANSDDKSAEEQLREAVWVWVQRLVVALVLMGAGYFAAWYSYGDAVELRQTKKELEDTIVDLKNQRETLSTKIARESRDKEVCRRDMKKLKEEMDGLKKAQ